MNTPIRAAVIVAMTGAGLAGCADLKPLETDVADLKTEVATLQTHMQEIRQATDQANAAARSAADAAGAAQKTANDALALAQSAQASIAATNEKLDRMFRRKLEK